MNRRDWFKNLGLATVITATAKAALTPRRVFCAVIRPDPPPYMGKWRYNTFRRYEAPDKKTVLHALVESGEAERLIQVTEEDCSRGDCCDSCERNVYR